MLPCIYICIFVNFIVECLCISHYEKKKKNPKHPYETSAQLGWGDERRPLLPFFENWKRCLDFGRKGPNCVHPRVEPSIQNVVLRVSRTKSSKLSPCEAFFCVFLRKSLSKCLNYIKPPLSWRISGCAPVKGQ